MDVGVWTDNEMVFEKILRNGGSGNREEGESEEDEEKVNIAEVKRLLERKLKLDDITRVLAYVIFVMVFWGKALI